MFLRTGFFVPAKEVSKAFAVYILIFIKIVHVSAKREKMIYIFVVVMVSYTGVSNNYMLPRKQLV